MNKIKLTILLLFICSISFGQVLKNNVLGFWKMETTAFRDEKGNNDGTNSGVSIVSGKVGNAGSFDGSADYVTMGDVLDFERTDPFSVFIWIFRDVAAGTNAFIGKMESSGNFRGWIMWENSGGDVEFILRSVVTTDFFSVLTTSGGVADVTWTHIAITKSISATNTGVKIYFDGVLQTGNTLTGNTITGTTVSSAPFNIGARNTDSRFWNGLIDEAIIYGHEANQTFVDLHYAGGNGRLYVWDNFIRGKIPYSEWLDYSLKSYVINSKYTA